MRMQVEVIPHKEQRYETIGDWQFATDATGADALTVRVSDLGDWRYNALVAVHEVVEALLCKNHGVKEADVDEFDKKFELYREEDDDREPGDSSRAPYHAEHCFATGVERVLAVALGVRWSEYEQRIDEVCK